MTIQSITSLLTALGVGTLLPMVVRGVGRWLTGRAGRERDAVAYERARADREAARAEHESLRADAEASKRRQVQEHASELRRQLIEAGVRPVRWPEIEDTYPRSHLRDLDPRRDTQ